MVGTIDTPIEMWQMSRLKKNTHLNNFGSSEKCVPLMFPSVKLFIQIASGDGSLRLRHGLASQHGLIHYKNQETISILDI